jgi:TatD DNase family protein
LNLLSVELTDTHCHLDYEYEGHTAESLVTEALAAGVTRLVSIGVDIPSIDRAQKLAEAFDNVWFTAGTHPHEAKLAPREQLLERIRLAARHPKCKAIGEIGLDYHYEHSPQNEQREVLEMQLELAVETRLPVVIHSREGEDDLLEHLTRYAALCNSDSARLRPPGVIHCFTGTDAFARACLDLGFFISISGIVTFKNADALRQSVSRVPLDRLMIETDSPYLAPLPHRGKPCRPALLPFTAMKVAEIKGITLEALALATNANADRHFGFSRD